MFATALTCTLQ
ncbi:Protein of unknown function [Bacillus mycoides]|nr:Protein of unknown function [Bacillus mycoides]